MNRGRRRLGERCDVKWETTDGMQTALGQGDPLGKPACAMNPDEGARSADILVAAATQVAAMTGDQGVDRNGLSGVRADACDLVPHDQRRDAERALAAKPFQFGSANADRSDIDENLTRRELRLGHVLKREGQRRGVDDRSHASPLSEVSDRGSTMWRSGTAALRLTTTSTPVSRATESDR